MGKVRALIELVLRYDPDGPQRIVGVLPAPDWAALIDGLRARVECERVDGGKEPVPRALIDMMTVEMVENILAEAGGWGAIVEAGRDVKRRHPKMWAYVESPPIVMSTWQEKAAINVKRILFESILPKCA
jgi:hypothetical protein